MTNPAEEKKEISVTSSQTPAAPAKKIVKHNDKPGKPYKYRGQGTSWYQPLMWQFGQKFSRLIAWVLFSLKVTGLENVPRTGPVLLVTNHQSFLDPWLIGLAGRRQLHYMARDSLFKGGLLHWLMECLNTYPVKRGSADLAAIRTTVERLQKGYMVNIFPEGTRTTDGAIGAIAPGVGLILSRAKMEIPVIPVVIEGAFEAWPRNRKLPKRHKIRIRFGTPLKSPETLKPAELADRIRQEMIQLQQQLGSPHAENVQGVQNSARENSQT